MSNPQWNAALSACAELEKLLDGAAPVPDPDRLNRIRAATARLQGSGDPYTATKAGMIASRAAIYLSTRKHQNESGGAEGLMHTMRYSLLGAIREQLEHMNKPKA
jgi:hypothetical protein